MLELWQKEKNLQWLNQLKGTLHNDGVWVWKETGFIYRLTDGEFVGDTEEATAALKEILP